MIWPAMLFNLCVGLLLAGYLLRAVRRFERRSDAIMGRIDERHTARMAKLDRWHAEEMQKYDAARDEIRASMRARVNQAIAEMEVVGDPPPPPVTTIRFLLETLFLLDPVKVSADAEGITRQLHTLIEQQGGVIEVSRPWDSDRNLTYPIGGQKKGSFHIIYYTLERSRLADLERDFRLQEGLILRHLSVQLKRKFWDAILRQNREGSGHAWDHLGPVEEAETTPTTNGNTLADDPRLGAG